MQPPGRSHLDRFASRTERIWCAQSLAYRAQSVAGADVALDTAPQRILARDRAILGEAVSTNHPRLAVRCGQRASGLAEGIEQRQRTRRMVSDCRDAEQLIELLQCSAVGGSALRLRASAAGRVGPSSADHIQSP